ncbi:hypothetical protein [Flavobacterium sp. '19STA2R22 D10 B1']|uniref:hypothetical protein n=1 Tax=Flavobacterium aerium TaxID=3037261 RepID=UPI00278C16F9|nr:hypothetical protein [Flavobacterium sp. '19STA2R22 D10 B1']
MNKIILYLVALLVCSSCESVGMFAKKEATKEEYKYYNKEFVLPAGSLLKTNGIYVKSTLEKFEYSKKNYDKYYKNNPHPAIGNNVPKNDTIIQYYRWYYYKFSNTGQWMTSGGFYSKENMLKDVKNFEKEGDYSIYKINNDIVEMESYNWYRKDFTYQTAKLKGDTLYVRGGTSTENQQVNGVPYIFYPMN